MEQNNLTQIESPYHPEHHIKVYVWIALVVVAFLVAINGYLYFLRLAYYQEGARTAQETEQKIQELRVKRGPVTSLGQFEVPSDWKTYRDEEYGFEVKYPDNWPTPKSSVSAGSFMRVFINNGQYFEGCCSGVKIEIITNEEFIRRFGFDTKPKDPDILSDRIITIVNANNQAREIIRVTHYGSNEVATFIPHGNQFIYLSRAVEDKVADQILSTFKFTDLGIITKTGYLTCLLYKPSAPIQECVIGFRDIEGNNYHLIGDTHEINDKNYEFQENNKQVTVSGKLTLDTNGYDAIGTITVSSFDY